MSLPEELRKIDYTSAEYDDAKLYGFTLPPLEVNVKNVVTYWHDGNGVYHGLKLLLIVPVTMHLIFTILNYWYIPFKAHASYVRTQNQGEAHYAYLRVCHKTGLVHEAHKDYFIRVHHYLAGGVRYQELQFENEWFNIIEDESSPGRFMLESCYGKQESVVVPDTDQTVGLTNEEYYQLKQRHGENRIVLKYPEYSKIFLDELLSPYFAFEVFTSVLYALDNFAMYSLFEFAFLFFNEGANMFSKYNSLRQVCKLAPKPVKVTVVRGGEEFEATSAVLVPGDVVVFRAADYNMVELGKGGLGQKEKEIQPFIPEEQLLNMPVFKLMFRLKEIIFGKYYDEKIYEGLNNIARSTIFPADMLLLSGELITDESILTGEQASQIKEPVTQTEGDETQPFNRIYAGTRLIQIQTEEARLLVTRTGLHTEQGKLIKTIAFNEDRMNITTKDSVVFLIVMFMVAVVSSVYVFHRGYNNNVCKLNKLFLESLLILVAVIPPDLPTELSMCIANSIREMREKKVFSSEPHRILNAGRVKYICFDKSGTLTQPNIQIIGVDEQLKPESTKKMLAGKKGRISECSLHGRMVLATCQSLAEVGETVLGDVLETSTFKYVGGVFDVADKNCVHFSKGAEKAQIVKRFYFNSNIKRMSVVVKHENKFYLAAKGSPESVGEILVEKPATMDHAVNEYNKCGYRVLCLAVRELSEDELQLERERLEAGLAFCGLLICQTPLKKDTAESINILMRSGHEIKVISGDHVINVAVSSQESGLFRTEKDIVVLEGIEGQQVRYSTISCSDQVVEDDMDCFLEKYKNICATNSNRVVSKLLDDKEGRYLRLFNQVTVFARTTPEQKQLIVERYERQSSESRTMFVGDGVNDLNALQSADIGVALLEEEPPEEARRQAKQEQDNVPYPSVMSQPGNRPATMMQVIQEAQKRATRNATSPQAELQVLLREQQMYKQYLNIQRMKNLGGGNGTLAMWTDAFDAEEEQQDIKMGDATIAAQFTVKSGSLEGVLDIIRQGRCALATVQMNFKTTALQCLVSAYSMTAMTLNGVRSSDYQMMASSLLQLAVMMNISKAKQQRQISDKKPPKTIVGSYLLFSMFAQALIHVSSLYLVQRLAGSDMHTVQLSAKFSPSLVNTCVFFMQMCLDTSITLVNYPGRPHMQGVWEHRKLLASVGVYVVGVLALVFEASPELNRFLGFVELPQRSRAGLLAIAAADFCLSYLAERLALALFD